MPASTARYELLRDRVERFTRLLHRVEDGDVDAVHRTRVASRRLRELLPVLQLDADETEKLGRRLRKVTEYLGAVRELDVLLQVIQELGETGAYQDAPLERVAANVRDERDRARARLMAKLPKTELDRLVAKLGKAADVIEAADAVTRPRAEKPRSWRWAIDARVARRAAAVLSAMASAGTVYLPERLHAVRISAKKLRYALEVAADTSHQKSRADLTQLRRMQDSLGRLHDLQVLVERVRQVQASLTPPDVTAWREMDRLIASLEDECRRLHGRYMRGRDGLAELCTRRAGHGAELKPEKVKAKRTAR